MTLPRQCPKGKTPSSDCSHCCYSLAVAARPQHTLRATTCWHCQWPSIVNLGQAHQNDLVKQKDGAASPSAREAMETTKFKVGGRVNVRSDTASPYRGRAGTIEHELPRDSSGFWYLVRFDLQGLRTISRFIGQDLELVSAGGPSNGGMTG
jgi:hypothetical protein